ncbi:hypothetical protein ACLOJK_036457, partial [Asimina triloba]
MAWAIAESRRQRSASVTQSGDHGKSPTEIQNRAAKKYKIQTAHQRPYLEHASNTKSPSRANWQRAGCLSIRDCWQQNSKYVTNCNAQVQQRADSISAV